MLDFHSHILPGLDDGAKDIDTAIEMARIAVEDGIQMMVATPHYIEGDMENHKELIIEKVKEFQDVLRAEGISLEVIPGCEVYLGPNIPDLLKKGELMTVNNGGKYLLVEFPMQNIPHYAEEVLFGLKVMGVTPIIAHPERNLEFAKKPELVFKQASKGYLMQMNSGSITGLYGKTVKKTAHFMVKNDLIHLIGSDAHSTGGRCPQIREAIDVVEKVNLGNEQKIAEYGKRVLTQQEVNFKLPIEINKARKGLMDIIKGIL